MKKKVLCALLCTAMVASLTACGSSSSKPADTSADTAKEESTDAADDTAEADTADAAASEGGRIFGYTCMDGTNPFFVTLEGAIREVVEAHGDTLISMDPANDSNTQINQIEDMISRGVEIMFVNPVDADGIIPALDMLKQEGLLEKLYEKICIGQGYRGKSGELGVGHCTRNFRHHAEGCPPTENQIYEFLKEYISR